MSHVSAVGFDVVIDSEGLTDADVMHRVLAKSPAVRVRARSPLTYQSGSYERTLTEPKVWTGRLEPIREGPLSTVVRADDGGHWHSVISSKIDFRREASNGPRHRRHDDLIQLIEDAITSQQVQRVCACRAVERCTSGPHRASPHVLPTLGIRRDTVLVVAELIWSWWRHLVCLGIVGRIPHHALEPHPFLGTEASHKRQEILSSHWVSHWAIL